MGIKLADSDEENMGIINKIKEAWDDIKESFFFQKKNLGKRN